MSLTESGGRGRREAEHMSEGEGRERLYKYCCSRVLHTLTITRIEQATAMELTLFKHSI